MGCYSFISDRERDRDRRSRGGGTRVPRHSPDEEDDLLEVDPFEEEGTRTLWGELAERDRQRARRRRELEEDDLAEEEGEMEVDSLERDRRSVLLFDEHDVHHMKYHDNLCRHQSVDQCAWPQCNLSCPKIRNPFTGQEMDFIDLLLQFGLDLSSIANALDMDLHTLQTMDHDHLLQLLIQH